MADLIERQAAIDALQKEINKGIPPFDDVMGSIRCGVRLARNIIEDLPSAQPEIAKRIVGKSRDGMTLWYQCDMCNEPVDVQDNYCRGCGRRLVDE